MERVLLPLHSSKSTCFVSILTESNDVQLAIYYHDLQATFLK